MVAAPLAFEGSWDPEVAPSFQRFRKHADFVPDVADFALTERQCSRLLAECGLDMHAGLGLGDVRILFHQLSKSGCITYDGLAQLYRILMARRRRVLEAINAEAAAARPRGIPVSERPMTAPVASPSSMQTSTPVRSMGSSHAPSPITTRQSPRHAGLPLQRGSDRFTELLQPIPTEAAPIAGRSRAGPGSPSGMPSPSGVPASSWPATLAGSSPLTGMSAVMAVRDPPLVLRETLPAPDCEFSHISTKIQGIKELMLNHETKLCMAALKEIYQEWEKAEDEKQVKERSRKKVGSADPAAAAVPAAATAATAEVPLEGAVFLLLMGGCCAMSLGEYPVARRVLSAAESKFNTQILGIEHPYYYAIFLCQGLVDYYDGRFEEALQKFENARDLSDQVARDKRDPTARKNSACCLNNMGACCQMLGRRAEAVASYRAAVQSLRNNVGLNTAAAEGAMSNLSKAVRSSFALAPMRPSTAPSFGLRPTRPVVQASGAQIGIVGLPVTVASAGGRLHAFLRQAVTMTAVTPVEALPTWASRSNGEEAAKKKAAKDKGKDGKDKKEGKDKKDGKTKKKKKSKGFQVSYPMTYYDPPTFGVANVSLAVKKKAKGKAKK